MTQQVYILEDKNSGLLKVGISVDVVVRVGQINKEFGCDAEIIGVLDVNSAVKTERFIHGMLEDCRVVGEWFEVDESRRNYLLAYFDAKPRMRRSKPSSFSQIAPELDNHRHGSINWFCEKIRQAMQAQPRGYQTALAETLGMSRAFINQMVSGTRPLPIDRLDEILASLNLSYDVVLSDLTIKPKDQDPEAGA